MAQFTEYGGRVFRATRPIGMAMIAVGDARREGRAPSHDGEGIVVAWLHDPDNNLTPLWWASDNGGLVGSVYNDIVEEARDLGILIEDLAEEVEVQEEIDQLVEEEPQPESKWLSLGNAMTEAIITAGYLVPCSEEEYLEA